MRYPSTRSSWFALANRNGSGVRFCWARSSVWITSCPRCWSQSASRRGKTGHRPGTSRGQGQNTVDTRKPGGKGQAGADVFAFEVRIISENLLRRHVPGQEFQHHAHRIAQPAHGGLAVANRRINRDAFQRVIHRALRCQTSACLQGRGMGRVERQIVAAD